MDSGALPLSLRASSSRRPPRPANHGHLDRHRRGSNRRRHPRSLRNPRQHLHRRQPAAYQQRQRPLYLQRGSQRRLPPRGLSPGFAQFNLKGIHLDPGDTRTASKINLAIGKSSQQVTVSENANVISTDNGEQSSLISSQDISHLSVEGRDVSELFKVLPGFSINTAQSNVVDNSTYDPSQVTVRGAGNNYTANGTLQNSVEYLYDGADITDAGDYGGTLQNINYEQVAEVKVTTSSFTADGAHGPVVINAVSKSGGAQYHGSLYIYARTNQLDSTDFLAKALNTGKPPDRQLYPGFTFGGPLGIPGTRLKGNKRFTFFIGAEDYAQRNVYAYGSASQATLTALVPTAAMRQGDFSDTQLQAYLGPQFTRNAGSPGCSGSQANSCYAPQSGTAGQALVDQNIAPYLDPGAVQMINTLPLPNVASTGFYNWTTTNLVSNDLWQAHARIDGSFGKTHVSAVYSNERGKAGVPQVEYYSPRGPTGGVNTPGGGLLNHTTSQFVSLNVTTLFSSTLTNELTGSGSYLENDFEPKKFSATDGGTGYVYQGLFNNGSHVLPMFQDYGYDGLPLSLLFDGSFGGIRAFEWVRTASDNLTKVLGNHTFRAGAYFQLNNIHQSAIFLDTNGAVAQYYLPESITDYVHGGTIHNTGAVGSGSGGNYLADFLEGNVFSYNQTNIQPNPLVYFFNVDFYLQDHYRLTRRISLDYGIRFSHLTPWGDGHNIGIPVFDPSTYNNPLSPVLPGFRWHAIDPNTPNTGLATRALFYEPRTGFTWDTRGTGETVLRGGFGIYRSHDTFNSVSGPADSVLGERSATVNYIALSQVYTQQSVATQGSGFVPDSSVEGFSPNDNEQPQTYTYNLALDQRLPKNTFLEIAFVGNHSDHLLNDGSTQPVKLDNINALPLGALYGPQPGTGTVYPILAPLNSNGATNVSVTTLDQAHIDSFRKYPLYNALQVPTHSIFNNYNALQVSLNHQHGRLLYGLNYTWAHALGIAGGVNDGFPTDPFNLRNDYTDLEFDRRNVFNATYSYDAGKWFTRNPLVGGFVNNWQLSGITTIQSGPNIQTTYITPNFSPGGTITLPNGQSLGVSATNLLGTPDYDLQPTLLCDPASRTKSNQYFNAACFGLTTNPGTNGVYRFPRLTGPGYFDTDLTVSKRIPIDHRGTIQLKLAAFNFINHGLTTFDAADQEAYTLNFNTTATAQSLPEALSQARSVNPGFGLAPLRNGRRILEMTLRYDF